MEAVAPKQQKKLFSIKGALALIDHAGVNSDDEESGVRRHMKLSRKEEEMMGHVKSKMRYAGETYHRVAAPEIEISKYTLSLIANYIDVLKSKRKRPDGEMPEEEEDDGESFNMIEFRQSGFSKYQKTE